MGDIAVHRRELRWTQAQTVDCEYSSVVATEKQRCLRSRVGIIFKKDGNHLRNDYPTVEKRSHAKTPRRGEDRRAFGVHASTFNFLDSTFSSRRVCAAVRTMAIIFHTRFIKPPFIPCIRFKQWTAEHTSGLRKRIGNTEPRSTQREGRAESGVFVIETGIGCRRVLSVQKPTLVYNSYGYQ